MRQRIRLAGLAGLAMLAGTAPVQCTGIPSVAADCQVFHHAAEMRITNSSEKTPVTLVNARITLHNGKQFTADLGNHMLEPGATALETVTLDTPAGGHDCTASLTIR